MSGRSAIVEPGDGELTIPPVLQPTTSIFSPSRSVLNVAYPNANHDTHFSFQNQSIDGVTPAQSSAFTAFAAGRWDIQLTHAFVFSGVIANTLRSVIELVDPDAGVIQISQFQHRGIGGIVVNNISLPVLFTRSGWYFNGRMDAGVAGDFGFSNCTIYARRIF